ncbi:MAG: hypothetical protein ALAOOOJD_00130 [bacterium]|nr:hypothetical protein [bacterium]
MAEEIEGIAEAARIMNEMKRGLSCPRSMCGIESSHALILFASNCINNRIKKQAIFIDP